jgi:Uma2 family endonuclease
MAETDIHRDLMVYMIQALQDWYLHHDRVYVSWNLLLFYDRRDRRRHISPDVFVVKGVEKGQRLNYILWEEGRSPQLVIELTSSSTRHEDRTRKFRLYQDVLRVQEYFLFDPHGDYLDPRLQGYRLRAGQYHPIRFVAHRLPSRVLGLHLEAIGDDLRLYDPQTGGRLPSAQERAAEAEERAAAAEQRAATERAESERLRQENLELRRRLAQD